MNYHVALSFAGEDRKYVDEVAAHLTRKGVSTFYDNLEEVNLWGKDLFQELSSIYKDRAHFTVIFISKFYASKLWPKHELKSAQARAFEESREYILPVRFDDTELPGILKTMGYLDLRTLKPSELADRIIAKLEHSGVNLKSPGPTAATSAIEKAPIQTRTSSANSRKEQALRAFTENGNVFVELEAGEVRQLTFFQLDEAPFLLNGSDEVVFVRRDETLGIRARKAFRRQVVIVSVHDLKERVIVDRKPQKDGLENTLDIMRIDQPYLSPDGEYLFFTTEGGATSSAFVKIGLKTGNWISIGSVERFEPLLDGPYTGHFLVSYSGIKASGRQAYYKVIDPDGHQVKEFADKASAQKFFDLIHPGPPRRLFERDALEFSKDGVELQAIGLIFNSKRERIILESRSPIHVSIDRIELQLLQEQWGHRLAAAGLMFTCQYFDASGKDIGSEKRPMSFGLFFDPTFRYPIFDVNGRWWFASQYNPYYPKEAHHYWRMTIELNGFELAKEESMELSLHSSTTRIV